MNILFSLVIGLLGICQAQAVEIKSLSGSEIAPYAKEISTFYNIIYREEPYFYYAPESAWDSYIQTYVDTPQSLVCLALDEEKIIGVAIGTPLENATEKYKMGFAARLEDLNSLFYLGEFALKPEYRHHGVGKTMYDAFERSVIERKQFSAICIWQLENTSSSTFWHRRGFELQPEIRFDELWRHAPGTEKIAHPMVCWKKEIKQ